MPEGHVCATVDVNSPLLAHLGNFVRGRNTSPGLEGRASATAPRITDTAVSEVAFGML
jgi:hypothetical protein